MKITILAILIISTITAHAQKDSAYKFAEVMGIEKLMSTKINLVVDSGQITKFAKDYRAKQDGKTIEFQGITGALNYMSKAGWIFLNAFPMTSGNSTVYHFYFKKLVPVSEIPEPIIQD